MRERADAEEPEEPDDASFGAALRRRRRAAGLTQEALAERAGVGVRTVQGLEGGQGHPLRGTARRLAAALGLPEAARARFVAAAGPPLRTPRAPAPPRLGLRLATPPPARPAPAPPGNLPAEVTSFVGRERELNEIALLLGGEPGPARAGPRLLTLTGAGGIGKTRLALRAATAALHAYPDGAWLVELAALADPALVPSAIARVLGVDDPGGRPIVAAVAEALRGKRLLLVLDNFEHVDEAAPVVAALLRAAPGLSVLVTSRAALRLYGEQELPVPPLGLPDQGSMATATGAAQAEATRLFVDRVRAARPGFALTEGSAPLVAELCRRLDGLPLALELAAARLRTLPLPALLDRMGPAAGGLPLLTGGARDLPARQQTLRATVAWSYGLLAPAEQALFRRLSVFRGCTLEAADAVCAAPAAQPRSMSIALPPIEGDVLDGLTSLVQKNLLRQEETEDGEPWYMLLQTIGEFAAERLADSAEAPAVRRRHILYYLRLAEAAEHEVFGPQQQRWLARLEREHDNLRAALDRCHALGYAEPAYRLAVAAWWFWQVRGHAREGRERLDSLLARFPVPAGGPLAHLRASALNAAANLATAHGDLDAARRSNEEALDLRRTLGDPAQVVGALEALGGVGVVRGDHATAQARFGEALALARPLGDTELTARLLCDLANVLHEQGDYGAARALADEALALLPALGRMRSLAHATLTRAIIARDEGDFATAQRLMEQGLALAEALGDARAVALALANLGGLAAARGDYAAAHERLGASLAIQQDLADAAGAAFVLERFAALAAAEGQPARALRLAGAAAALRGAAGVPLPPVIQAKLDAGLAPPRQALGDAAADLAWRAGQALSTADAVAEALDGAGPAGGPPSGGPPAGALVGRPDAEAAPGLTARQREVARLISAAYTNRQIAQALVISEGTVANHVVHILNKLGFGSRVQIAAWAVAQGLTAGPPAAGGG